MKKFKFLLPAPGAFLLALSGFLGYNKKKKQKIPPNKKHRHRPFLDGCGHSSFNFISLCFLRQSRSDTLRFCSFLFSNKHRNNSSILFCCVFQLFFELPLSRFHPVPIPLPRYRFFLFCRFFEPFWRPRR